MTLAGALTTLYNFCAQSDCADGAYPGAGLVQATNGIFYGTTAGGGANGDGVIFSLAVGLNPFVETVPGVARVGNSVMILGTGVEGSTSVTFDGTAAAFKVISGSLISTTVPAGATTGPVQVATPSGTLTSNVNFQVVP